MSSSLIERLHELAGDLAPGPDQTALDAISEIERLRPALGKAFIAMRIAKAIPAVAAEYDFDEAIDAASNALHHI